MKKILFLTMATMGIALTGCNKELRQDTIGGDDKTGSFRITIQNEAASSGHKTRIIGEPTPAEENAVKNFTVFVFHQGSGVLEKSASFTDALTGTVSGLSTATTKRVVVYANVPSSNASGLASVTQYSDLLEFSNTIQLSTQKPADISTNGLFMSGQVMNKTIIAGGTVTVPVSRLVAKVKLADLKIEPGSGVDVSKFEITGISIQKAPRDQRPLSAGPGALPYLPDLLGGVQTYTQSVVHAPWLYDAWTLPTDPAAKVATHHPGAVFYVFESDFTRFQDQTAMAIQATYDGAQRYFTFVINGTNSETDGGTDGRFIQRNMVYSLNVTLKNLSSGADNPDATNEKTDITVTVTPQDWDGTLTQNEEW